MAVLATVSPHCLFRARYELHEVPTELARKEKDDARDPSDPDHGGLNSGEDTLMVAVAGMVTATLPKLKRLS